MNKPSDPIFEMFDQNSFIFGEEIPENRSDSNNTADFDPLRQPNVDNSELDKKKIE